MYQVLLIDNQFKRPTEYSATTIKNLTNALLELKIEVTHVSDFIEAKSVVASKVVVHCVLFTRTLNCENDSSQSDADKEAIEFLDCLHERQPKVPVFLLSDRGRIKNSIGRELMLKLNELVWIWEDSAEFVAKRVEGAITRYTNETIPPLTAALIKYKATREYSWAAPGHQGGIGFKKTAVGRAFHDFFGSNLFRLDLGIERSELGSLVDHTGPFGQAEKFISRVFGSDASFSGVVGTSGSNRTIMQSCVKENSAVLIDRNCHKSIEQGLILTGARPTYMISTRNRYGIIGPIRKGEMMERAGQVSAFSYGVVTNCTYDGICYNADKVESILKSLPFLHFDEAWYGYARFNVMYDDHYAMRGDPAAEESKKKNQTIFATHSTHKMLNALSQGSFIHVRDSRGAVDFARFNQAYAMHTTTSPLYTIALSNEVAAHMMDGESGKSLIQETINEAVDFRQYLARWHRQYEEEHDWFFKPWNPDKINGELFENVHPDVLTTTQRHWILSSKDDWHGFGDIDDDWVMLDPVKVSILCPGMNEDGSLAEKNVVPAALVGAWLGRYGIVPTRTTDFQLMFLFSMGVTKGKWATLLETLLSFKQSYDKNVPLRDALPQLADKYDGGKGLRDLGDDMVSFLRDHNLTSLLNEAYNKLPEQAVSPKEAYQSLIDEPTGEKANVEMIPVESLAGRVVATAILPYPPGIPMMISGERFGNEGSPQIGYLSALETWDNNFPGFEHVTEGVERDKDGKFWVQCIKL